MKNTELLSIAESAEYLDKKKESDAKMLAFIKKFTELSPKDAKEMKEKIEALGLIKINPEKTVKIVDLLPDNSDEVNKIFSDVSLDEEEINKIVDIVKQYK